MRNLSQTFFQSRQNTGLADGNIGVNNYTFLHSMIILIKSTAFLQVVILKSLGHECDILFVPKSDNGICYQIKRHYNFHKKKFMLNHYLYEFFNSPIPCFFEVSLWFVGFTQNCVNNINKMLTLSKQDVFGEVDL